MRRALLMPAGRRSRVALRATSALAWALACPALVGAQTPPPPCRDEVKGRVVSVAAGGASVALERQGKTESHPVSAAATAVARALKVGDQVTLDLDCKMRPPQVVAIMTNVRAQGTPGPVRPVATPSAPLTTVLISSADDCELFVDYKLWGKLVAGKPDQLKLSQGQHPLKATGAKGRTWESVVNVGSGQMVVEVKLGAPVATVAEVDAQVGKACGALSTLKAAGQELDAVLRSSGFKFHKADSVAVATASARWARELGALKVMVPPAERAQASADLAGLDPTVVEYAETLVKALQTAQEKNTIMGEASTLRARAQALLPLMELPGTLPSTCGGPAPATEPKKKR